MSVPVIQPSFAKGEIAPSLYARTDLAAYHAGAALLRNFTVDYRGGATSRPGTRFLARARASEDVSGVAGRPRLIPFVFSSAIYQAYVLEFGNQYMRVHMQGADGPGPVLEPAIAVTGATQANPCAITASAYGATAATASNAAVAASYAPGDHVTIATGDAGTEGAVFGVTNTTLVSIAGGGGQNYAIGDTITLAGGTASPAAVVTVASLNANTYATGTITFSAQPAASSTLTINGQSWVFVTTPAAEFESPIGSNLADTLAAAAAMMNAITSGVVTDGVYSSDATHLYVRYFTTGTAGNLFTIAASSGSNGTASGTHLSGGGASTGVASVTVSTGGVFTANPAGGVMTQASTSGSGTGATFDAALFGPNGLSIVTAGNYAATPANPVAQASTTGSGSGATFTVTWGAAQAFDDGDAVTFAGIGGMTALDGMTCLVANASTSGFTITDLDGNSIDATAWPAFTSGGTVARLFTLATPYAAADLALLKFTQSADMMWLTHPSYQPRTLTRTEHWSWQLAPVTFAATVQPPASPSGSSTASGGSFSYAYVVTARTDDPAEESIASSIVSLTGLAALNQSTGIQNTVTWSPPASGPPPSRYNVYAAQPVASSTGAPVPAGSQYGLIGTTTGCSFIDTNIQPSFAETPPLHLDPFAPGAVTAAVVTGGGTGYSASPSYTVDSATGSGLVLQLVSIGGVIEAAVVIDGGSGYQPGDGVTVTDTSGTGAAVQLTIGPQTGTWPSTVAFYQSRLMFASTLNQPESYWGTQPGNWSNMDYGVPSADDDAVSGTITSQQLDAVEYMLAVPNGLMAMTAQGSYLIGGGGVGASAQALTPSNQLAMPQASNGVAPLCPPIKTNFDFLIVQARGSYVRDFQYNLYANIFTGIDISAISNHLFNNHQLLEWAWDEEPNKIVWAVRDDGVMLSLTYLKEQEVSAWAHHDTAGVFCSVATIPEGLENGVYTVVQRYVNDEWLYYVERFASRMTPGGDPTRGLPPDVRQAWCLDAAIAYPLTCPAATLTPPASLTPSSGQIGPATYTGTGVFTASAPVTVNAGDVLEINGGVATVTAAVSDGTGITAAISAQYPLQSLLPAASGAWSCTTPVSAVSGLTHLEGLTVGILADGNPQPAQIVTGGAVTLSAPATRILVGLPFTCQMMTLPFDAGEPTARGRRKKISAVTVITQDSAGLKVGHSPSTLHPFRTLTTSGYQNPLPLTSGDMRIVLDPLWNKEGQLLIQQDAPLPAQILGVIPEVVIGDDPG